MSKILSLVIELEPRHSVPSVPDLNHLKWLIGRGPLSHIGDIASLRIVLASYEDLLRYTALRAQAKLRADRTSWPTPPGVPGRPERVTTASQIGGHP